MVPKKTKHLPFTFVFVVYVLQDIPLFLGKKKKKRVEKNSLHTDRKIMDKLQPDISLGSFA